ncbi:hypothetical protein MANES_06G067300v8 [Manihot esculenta]|uniref:Uncharacterized protein n=2 Tax=Manihot esculenta TaxID=3983 RepID=A0ACB7HHR2_MANES|nr:hypothetical protein MANES_06G067300v8 [Manihot esculenta]
MEFLADAFSFTFLSGALWLMSESTGTFMVFCFSFGGPRVKSKTCLTLSFSRIKLPQNRRDLRLKHMLKEIAQFWQAGQEAILEFGEQNIWAAYDILELFCGFVLAHELQFLMVRSKHMNHKYLFLC